ncbi:DNA mismatch repair protein MutL [Clostridium acetireducens DSM 10703]|uniref:DNA mismatch repair protein MutL n=1 Tax=Clostridium acetireducens DSM 10703 TaxID=1121290 RepID=A0A1E8F2C8_9CLOT|nr:DNA mismatch repair endonuclease MutL [Clostridium acetireducens]OFI07759.1 DNA mismatch repair protein MutL [Clostridium acetireducens DSM 10703]
MLKRINILDEKTINKIAAGEVVEAPYSVVKELVENSIDAKSKNITIEIEEGGQKSIKITDDGIGIHAQDIEKAFIPHATSKISSLEDIYQINSMGFRGEALSSIAAVSKVLLKSKIEKLNFGKEISIEGGKINYIKDVGCNTGTIVEVKDLFFNVPARKKFLKSQRRDTSLISDIINRLAISNSDISFKYINSNKKSLITYGTGKIKDVIRSIYGKKTYENIIYFENHLDVVSMYGYIGNSNITRKSRTNQSIFVNKRYVKSGLISAAVENAFKSFTTVNNHPFFVLFIDIFPEFIDVNIHPSKSEIKFNNERYIFKTVFNCIHETLKKYLKNNFSYSFENKILKDLNNECSKESILEENKIEKIKIPIDFINKDNNTYKSQENNKFNHQYIQENNNKLNPQYAIEKENTVNNNLKTKKSNIDEIDEIDKISKKNNLNYDNIESKFGLLNIIGKFDNTYIIAENYNKENKELYIIDQHAAHEKILFEKYLNEIKTKNINSQILLCPTVLELSLEDFTLYEENKCIFEKSGFHIEIFGNNTICIKEVPIILDKSNIENLFANILDNIKNMGSGKTEEIQYDLIAKTACKSAVKAKHQLSDIEIKHLIEQLRFIDNPFTCPHGRPTIIKITLKDLEKKFKRIQ